ncbi:MAG: hypothetical protein ACRD0B_06390 [Acidimicrobiales bacterium]
MLTVRLARLEAPDPGADDALEASQIERVGALPAAHGHAHEPGFLEHPEMPGRGRPRAVEA